MSTKRFYLFLASIEKSRLAQPKNMTTDGYGRDYGYGHRYGHEHELLDVFETTLVMSKVFDSAERVVAENVDIEESFFVQEDVFQDESWWRGIRSGASRGMKVPLLPTFTAVQ